MYQRSGERTSSGPVLVLERVVSAKVELVPEVWSNRAADSSMAPYGPKLGLAGCSVPSETTCKHLLESPSNFRAMVDSPRNICPEDNGYGTHPPALFPDTPSVLGGRSQGGHEGYGQGPRTYSAVS